MPYPTKGESKDAYIKRFMASPEANKDYPDEKQRYAVAHGMWERRNATGDEGWPKLFSCTFIEPGVVFYQDLGEAGETVLVQKPALDKMAKSFVGKPVVNLVHKDVDPKTVARGEADGIVSRVWLDEESGWYKCEFLVWDELTQRNCESKIYSVSCAYEPTDVDSNGGVYHNLPFQEEVLDGVYTHLAVVANPRYEGARIFVNSKGGSPMNWKFWAPKATKKNAADIDPSKTMVNVDGEKVTLQQLYDAVTPGEAELEMSDDTMLCGPDGKERTLGDMKNALRAKRKNAEDEAAAKKKAEDEKLKNGESEEELRRTGPKNDAAEEAAKKLDAETKEKEALERQQAADAETKKKDDEKHNALEAEKKAADEKKREEGRKSFENLKGTARERSGDPVGIKLVTSDERIAAGKQKYGSAPK